MKQFLTRLLFYVPIITFFWQIFVPNFFKPNFPGPFVAQAISWTVYLGITYGFWIAAYELCYRAAKAFRKSKPAPETQPLSAIQRANNPTTPIDTP